MTNIKTTIPALKNLAIKTATEIATGDHNELEWKLRAASFLYDAAIKEAQFDIMLEALAEEKAAKAAHGAMITGSGMAGNSWPGNPGVYPGTDPENVPPPIDPALYSQIEDDDDETPDITPSDAVAEELVELEADEAVTEEDE